MKTFFDGIFLDSEKLKDEGIEYPIKIEYYKTIAKEENVEAKYGIEIVRKDFVNGEIKKNSEKMDNIIHTDEKADEVLTILRNHQVTPISMQDVLQEMMTTV